jgi:hypothetical protein
VQNGAKHGQKHVAKPFLARLWEILCEPLLLLGQFHGSTHPREGQFHGICLKESQPPRRTFAGRAVPLKRTFGRVNAPAKPTFALIPRDFQDQRREKRKMQVILSDGRPSHTSHSHFALITDH